MTIVLSIIVIASCIQTVTQKEEIIIYTDECWIDGELNTDSLYCTGYNNGYQWQRDQKNIGCSIDISMTRHNCKQLLGVE